MWSYVNKWEYGLLQWNVCVGFGNFEGIRELHSRLLYEGKGTFQCFSQYLDVKGFASSHNGRLFYFWKPAPEEIMTRQHLLKKEKWVGHFPDVSQLLASFLRCN